MISNLYQRIQNFRLVVIKTCLVFYLQIMDSSGCPGEKGRTFIKSKMLLEVQISFFHLLNVNPSSPRGFFTFLVALALSVPWKSWHPTDLWYIWFIMALRVIEFQVQGYKIRIFLPKNQQTQRKLLNFENFEN